MKNLSLPEFRDYCNEHKFDRITYSTTNQTHTKVDSTVSADLEFNKIIITFNPNIILLDGEGGSLKYNKVKSVKLCESCLLGQVFAIVCGDKQNKTNDREYTLVAAYKNFFK